MVQGIQTAVVTGPGGEEIYVDKYGRVKVQFFWDRKGKKNESSSCWIRVAEQWAGKNWGFVCNPRIGQEVIVDFLEGDPDRPLITGRVYNAEQMPPYDLPGNMTQSGIRSRSSKGGSPANCNEIMFEDKKGSELVSIHAEKDQSISVEHDESHTVGHDRTKTIDNDETTHVKHDRTETVDNNETITIHQNRTETVDVNETISVGGDRKRTVSGNESVTVVMTRNHAVGINEAITVGGAREVTVGGFQAITVGAYQAITVGGYQAFIVGANHSLQVAKNLTENIGGDRGETVVGKRTDNIGKDHQSSVGGSLIVSIKKDQLVNVEKNFQLEAGEKIVLQTGDASITMNKNGTILIKGKDISVECSGKHNIKADGDIAMKGSKITQN
jgi:type VI secretion system secreted protein VgrG